MSGLPVQENPRPVVVDGGLSEASEVKSGSGVFEPTKAERIFSDDRNSVTHHFEVAGHDGYIIVGLFDDGSPREIFIKTNKMGSTIHGMLEDLAISVSIGIKDGVHPSRYCEKLINRRYEPLGFTKNPEIREVRSITDYIFRWLANHFGYDIPEEQSYLEDL